VQGLTLVLGSAVLAVLLTGDVITRVLQQRTRRQELS
jgi:ABC-type dipeptide/oligopeptide/nickel transport system permease component